MLSLTWTSLYLQSAPIGSSRMPLWSAVVVRIRLWSAPTSRLTASEAVARSRSGLRRLQGETSAGPRLVRRAQLTPRCELSARTAICAACLDSSGVHGRPWQRLCAPGAVLGCCAESNRSSIRVAGSWLRGGRRPVALVRLIIEWPAVEYVDQPSVLTPALALPQLPRRWGLRGETGCRAWCP